jgi:hypothetical protein
MKDLDQKNHLAGIEFMGENLFSSLKYFGKGVRL